MVKKAVLLCLSFCFVQSFFGQGRNRFFSDSSLMLVGSYYYPEQWPKDNWARDLKKMGELGFDFTHFGEFAWAAMEPEEGRYDFSWLDEAVKIAEKNHLKVIMCTPTPTPPAWLTKKYPEVLMVNDEGRTIRHGARQHASWSSKKYREYVEKIVTILARRYGNNKAVWGWQIDNEPSHYGSPYDYNASAQANFREWLRKKYKTIDALNKSWATTFWSLTYNDFNQIRIPNAKELVQQPNPHAILDFKRFTADEVASFVLFQQKILRKYVSPQQWITTNLIPDFNPVDPNRMAALDIMTYTKYLVAGFEMGEGEQGFRMGSSTSIGYSNDRFRPINGLSGVMELQPGQVNWGKYNPQTMPGTVRMWIYHVFAGGNKFVCNYRFRQPLFAGEQYHYGILKTDGITVSSSGDEYIQVIKELHSLKKSYHPGTPVPPAYAARKTAILFSQESQWETDNQPQTNQWNFMNHIMKYYRALQSFGAPVDVIDEHADFSAYPVVIAPCFQLLDKALVAKWKNYVEQGGHLVLTCRTGQKDREAHLWEAKFAAPIYDLIGAKEISYDLLPEERTGHIKMGEQTFKWNNWADVIEAGDAEVVATYNDQFYKGKAAVVFKKIGKGTVTYIGPDTDDGELEREVLKKLYTNAGIGLLDLPKGVVVGWRDGFWIGLNYTSQQQNIPVPDNATIMLGSKTLAPADVVIWKE